LTSAIVGQCLASRSPFLYSRRRIAVTREPVGSMEKREFLILSGHELRFPGRPAVAVLAVWTFVNLRCSLIPALGVYVGLSALCLSPSCVLSVLPHALVYGSIPLSCFSLLPIPTSSSTVNRCGSSSNFHPIRVTCLYRAFHSAALCDHSSVLAVCKRELIITGVSVPYSISGWFSGCCVSDTASVGLVVRVPGCRSRGPGFDSRCYQVL
jgi:hypothetical protein